MAGRGCTADGLGCSLVEDYGEMEIQSGCSNSDTSEILDLQAVPEVWEVIALMLSLKKSDTTLQEFFSL